MYGTRGRSTFRFHNLKAIDLFKESNKKASTDSSSFTGGTKASASDSGRTIDAIYTLANLASAVKENDMEADGKKNDNPTSTSAVVNPDGTRYVKSDRKLLAGEKPENWGKQLEAYINEKIRFDEIVDADGYRFNVEKEEATDPTADHTAGSDDNGTPVTSSKNILPQTAANSKENPLPESGKASAEVPGQTQRTGLTEGKYLLNEDVIANNEKKRRTKILKRYIKATKWTARGQGFGFVTTHHR